MWYQKGVGALFFDDRNWNGLFVTLESSSSEYIRIPGSEHLGADLSEFWRELGAYKLVSAVSLRLFYAGSVKTSRLSPLPTSTPVKNYTNGDPRSYVQHPRLRSLPSFIILQLFFYSLFQNSKCQNVEFHRATWRGYLICKATPR